MRGGTGLDISPRAGDVVETRRLTPSHMGIGAKAGISTTSVAARTSGTAAGTASADGAGRADRGLGAATSARRP